MTYMPEGRMRVPMLLGLLQGSMPTAHISHVPRSSKCGRASVQWDKVDILQPLEQEPDGSGNFLLRTNSRNSRKCAYG